MKTEIRVDDFTCIARTVAEKSAKYGHRICCAGLSPSLGGLVRVYPLPIENNLRAWSRYQLEVKRNPQDSRKESYRIVDEFAPIVVKRKEDRYKHIHTLLERFVVPSIQYANRNRLSLAVVIPSRFKELDYRDTDRTEEVGAGAIPLRPYITFDDDGGQHALQLREIGCFEWLRKQNAKHRLWENLGMHEPNVKQALLVGNMCNRRNVWLIISMMRITLSKVTNEIQNLPAFRRLESQKGFGDVARTVAV